MKRRVSLVASLVALGSFVCLSLAASPSAVPYPEGYRAWQHVKSMVIGAGHPLFATFGGIHHLYANKAAMTGYRTGTFPDGALIVFDLLEVSIADGATIEGTRKVVGVMHRDARRYAATGGWGFEGFAGDSKTSRVVGDQSTTACFACHTAQAKHSYVFSSYRP
jgi:Cytochrome P460